MAGLTSGERSVPALASAMAVGALVGAAMLWPRPVDGGHVPAVAPMAPPTQTAAPTAPAAPAPAVLPPPVDPPPVDVVGETTSAPIPEATVAAPSPPATSVPSPPRRVPTPTLRTPMSVSPTPRTAFPDQPGGTGDSPGGGLLPGIGLGPL